MTDCLHIHDEEVHDVGYVCVPGPVSYQVAVHRFGARDWEAVGESHGSITEAFRALGEVFERNRNTSRRYNRGGIWAVEFEPSYYEPRMVYEVIAR